MKNKVFKLSLMGLIRKYSKGFQSSLSPISRLKIPKTKSFTGFILAVILLVVQKLGNFFQGVQRLRKA